MAMGTADTTGAGITMAVIMDMDTTDAVMAAMGITLGPARMVMVAGTNTSAAGMVAAGAAAGPSS